MSETVEPAAAQPPPIPQFLPENHPNDATVTTLEQEDAVVTPESIAAAGWARMPMPEWAYPTPPAPPPPATGATAGTPGTFTPAGAAVPANLAAMSGIVASPATAWTTGQYVALGDSSQAHWSGSAWVAGAAP